MLPSYYVEKTEMHICDKEINFWKPTKKFKSSLAYNVFTIYVSLLHDPRKHRLEFGRNPAIFDERVYTSGRHAAHSATNIRSISTELPLPLGQQGMLTCAPLNSFTFYQPTVSCICRPLEVSTLKKQTNHVCGISL